MSKTTETYWNPLLSENQHRSQPVADMEEAAEEVMLAMDHATGDYTRLTRFRPGADTAALGPKSHHYPEEILIIEGRLYDGAFDRWLAAGDGYTARVGQSRRYLHEHMDRATRQAFAASFRECAIGSPDVDAITDGSPTRRNGSSDR